MGRAARWLGAGLACLLIGAPTALADGGPKIAGAPTIPFGEPQFGSTLNGGRSLDGAYNSYWSLPVIAGDQITIEWRGQSSPTPDTPQLAVYSVGTTDDDVAFTHSAVSKTPYGDGLAEVTFTASKTGTMPTDFQARGCLFGGGCANHAGPYDFIAFVRHASQLALPTLGSLPIDGTVAVSARNPDGAAISDGRLYIFLQIKPADQQWANVGSASPADGTAKIAYVIPASLAGQHVQVRAVTGGAYYLPEQTAAEQVLVFHPAAAAHKKHRRHRKRHRHRKHEHRRRHR